MSLAIITDSTSCLHPGTLEETDIELVPAWVVVHGRPYRDWLDIQPESVYVALTHKVSVQTRPPDMEDFATQYEQALQRYDRVLSIHSSLDLSLGLVQANMAALQVAPGRIRILDSRSVSAGLGVQALRAWELAQQGLDEAAIVAQLEHMARHSSFYFTVADLAPLFQGGRLVASVKGFDYSMGLGVILQCLAGELKLVQPVLQEQLLQTLFAAASRPFSSSPIELSIVHSDADLDKLGEVHNLVGKSGLDVRYLRLLRVSPSVAAHVGEGGLGIHICERLF